MVYAIRFEERVSLYARPTALNFEHEAFSATCSTLGKARPYKLKYLVSCPRPHLTLTPMLSTLLVIDVMFACLARAIDENSVAGLAWSHKDDEYSQSC